MGYVRLLLAVIVLVQHANAGAVGIGALAAVQAFFLISGYYMAAAYTKYYRGAPVAFWISRYLRLYPLYFVTLAAMAGFWIIARPVSNNLLAWGYFNGPPQPHVLVWSLIGQDVASAVPNFIYAFPIRQAWSISAELVFYALTPLLLLVQNRLLWLAAVAFAGKICLIALFGWSYSYYPFYGEIGYFMVGMWAYSVRDKLLMNPSATNWLTVAVCLTLTVVFGRAANFYGHYQANLVMVIVLVVTIPTMFANDRSRWSKIAGDLSYGVYIVHFPIIAMLDSLGVITIDDLSVGARLSRLAVVLALSLAAAYIFEVAVQSRVDAWRRKAFYNRSGATLPVADASRT